MGWTRPRRYANHKSGRKYSDKDKKTKLTKEEIEEKVKREAKDFNLRNKKHKLKTLTKEVAPRMSSSSFLSFF